MALDSELLEILRCPEEHRAALDYDAASNTLTCAECHQVFSVEDDVPILVRAQKSVTAEGDQVTTSDPGETPAEADGSDQAESDDPGKADDQADSGDQSEPADPDDREGEQQPEATASSPEDAK